MSLYDLNHDPRDDEGFCHGCWNGLPRDGAPCPSCYWPDGSPRTCRCGVPIEPGPGLCGDCFLGDELQSMRAERAR